MPANGTLRFKIFISYRREDEADFVKLLRKYFSDYFGANNVFMDSYNIENGAQWKEVIPQKIRWCDAMVVIIGPKWVDLIQKKAIEEFDPVRMEVAMALAEKKVIIPVCIKGVPKPPEEKQIHYEVRGMLNHHGAVLPNNADNDEDIERMIDSIGRNLVKQENLAKEVQKLDEIPPAAGLALGYYVNFVRPVVQKVTALTEERDECLFDIRITDRGLPPIDVYSFGRESVSRKDLRLHIVIPQRASFLKTRFLDPVKRDLRQAHIYAGEAVRTFVVDAWTPNQNQFQLVDFPNTLTVVEDWVRRRLTREQCDPQSVEWQQLENEEIKRFETMLQWWVDSPENSTEFRDRVRIVRFTQGEKEFAWLEAAWNP